MRPRLACMDEDTLTTGLDTCTGVGLEPPRRVELLTRMAGRRRLWSLEQKLAIVAEAEHCDNLSALAQRYDIRRSQIYTWRRELRYAVAARKTREPAPMFVPAVADAARREDVAIEVEVDGAVARIAQTTRADLAAAVVRALRASR